MFYFPRVAEGPAVNAEEGLGITDSYGFCFLSFLFFFLLSFKMVLCWEVVQAFNLSTQEAEFKASLVSENQEKKKNDFFFQDGSQREKLRSA